MRSLTKQELLHHVKAILRSEQYGNLMVAREPTVHRSYVVLREYRENGMSEGAFPVYHRGIVIFIEGIDQYDVWGENCENSVE